MIGGTAMRRNSTTMATAEASRMRVTFRASCIGSIYTFRVSNLLQPNSVSEAERLLELARGVLDIEAQAVHALRSRLGEAFLRAHDTMLRTVGRVVVTGMGKSGHIGRKIASTLASTGTPAFFMHPGE